MKFTLVIPIYLSRKLARGFVNGDVVYDHPTSIDEKGTLVRTVESLSIIKRDDFNTVFLISTVNEELESMVQPWIEARWKEVQEKHNHTYYFTHSHLRKLVRAMGSIGFEDTNSLLSLQGYSQTRNFGLIAGALLDSDVVVWLDDDELIRDQMFFKKICEGFEQKIGGEKVRLLTGACPEGEVGSYLRVRDKEPWMEYWDKIHYQNQAFREIIGTPPRWKVSPFAFGGLSAIHRDVFLRVPYDPSVQRGEDMDYNMNVRMFGYHFFLDNTLEIRHLPPLRAHPQWRRVRADLQRYLRQRDKLRYQFPIAGMKHITAEMFDPYPGRFLKDDLEEMINKSQTMLASLYEVQGKLADANEARRNIDLAKQYPHQSNAFAEYVRVQRAWESMMKKMVALSAETWLTPLLR